MNAKVALGPSSEMGVIGLCGRTVVISVHVLKSLRFGRDSRFVINRIHPVLIANSGALLFVFVWTLRKHFYAVVLPVQSFTGGGLWHCVCGTLHEPR